MWCRSSYNPSIIIIVWREYTFCSWPTHDMKIHAVGLHVNKPSTEDLAGMKSIVLEHVLEYHKPVFYQNAPNRKLTISLVLPRGYHDLATRFCWSNILQCLDCVLFQESYLCFFSASDAGNFNWKITEFCLLSLLWSARNLGVNWTLLWCVQSPKLNANCTPMLYQNIY